MAYDHKEIIAKAVGMLQQKMEHSNIVYSLLPKEFTLSDLQGIYEIILGKAFDKRNFRKKMLSLHMLKSLSKKKLGEANRPAALFSFKSHSLQEVDII